MQSIVHEVMSVYYAQVSNMARSSIALIFLKTGPDVSCSAICWVAFYCWKSVNIFVDSVWWCCHRHCSAVARTVLIATPQVNGKGWILERKKTWKSPKIVTVDYYPRHDATLVPNLVKIHSRGRLGKWVEYCTARGPVVGSSVPVSDH